MKKVSIVSAIVLIVFSVSAQTLKDAIRLTDNEQFEAAEAAFRKLIKNQPSLGENYFYLGENFFKTESFDSAYANYKKGTDVNATNGLCYVGLGKIKWLEGKREDAQSLLYKATVISQNKDINVLLKIAELYINASSDNFQESIKYFNTLNFEKQKAAIPKDNPNYENIVKALEETQKMIEKNEHLSWYLNPTVSFKEAEKYLNQALKLDPKSPEVYLLMGDNYLFINDGTQAVKNYEMAFSLDKSSVKAILRQGQVYSRAKNYSLALDYYKNASKIDSTYAPAYREKAEIYGRAGQFQNAIYNYKRYLALNGNNLTARIRYAQFLYSGKQYKNAVEEIREIHKQDSSNVNLYRIMGYSLYESGDYANGLSYMKRFFDKAQKVNKKILASDYEYLGKNMMKTGNDSLGVINVMKAMEMDTTRIDLYADLGLSCMKQKKYDCAIKYFEKKIAVTPTPGVNDYYNVGRAYYFNKEYVKADSAFSKIIVLQPNMPIGYFWKARANSAQDLDLKLGLAKPHYELFIQKAETDKEKNKKDLIEAYDYMGSYYGITKKDLAAAKPFYQKMLELDPENVKAKKFMSSQEAK